MLNHDKVYTAVRIALTYGRSTNGIKWKNIPEEDLWKIIDFWREPLEFLGESILKSRHSSFAAVMLRIYPWAKKNGRLDELKAIAYAFMVSKGSEEINNVIHPENPEARNTLFRLLDHMKDAKKKTMANKGRGGSVEKNIFWRIQSMVYSYFLGEVRERVYTTTNDRFPLEKEIYDFAMSLSTSEKTSSILGVKDIDFHLSLASIMAKLPEGTYPVRDLVTSMVASSKGKFDEKATKKYFVILSKRDKESIMQSSSRTMDFENLLPENRKDSQLNWISNSTVRIKNGSEEKIIKKNPLDRFKR